MNHLIDNNFVKEINCGHNFSYVLNDNSIFLSTEYRVLQSQTNSCFVRCMKMMYNGKIQLYYLVNNLKPLSSMIYSLDSEGLLTIISNFLSDVIDVKNNGFLSCQNIDISFEKIYIDPITYKVSLVYVPIINGIFDDNLSFENQIRTEFVKLITNKFTLSTPKIMQFLGYLSNGTLSIEDLYAHINIGHVICDKGLSIDNSNENIKKVRSNFLRIIAINVPTSFEIVPTKDNYIIGKQADICDGIIDFNKTISRSHCKININGNQYLITDLQSANGTYLNWVRLQPNQPYPINNGDILRLSNSDFRVSIE